MEGDFTVFLVNAAHVQNVPGRKTDRADARWLAKLMRQGLLQASFIPPAPPADTAGATGGAADANAPAAPLPFTRALTVLDTIPGVDQRGGELLVAEWGIDMARFGTAERLSAWSGVAPGNDESAGTQRSGKTRQGNRALRTGLT